MAHDLLHTTPKFVRRRQHNLLVGLTLSFNPKHNIFITPADNTYFVSKLAIVKYFDGVG